MDKKTIAITLWLMLISIITTYFITAYLKERQAGIRYAQYESVKQVYISRITSLRLHAKESDRYLNDLRESVEKKGNCE